MDKDARRRALQDAAHRQTLKAEGKQQCRVCGGEATGHYCRRHFFMLDGYPQLMHEVKQGRMLEEADALCLLKTAVPALRFVDGAIILAFNTTARLSDNVWVVRKMNGDGREFEIIRCTTARQLYEWGGTQRKILSVRNPYASKTLIK